MQPFTIEDSIALMKLLENKGLLQAEVAGNFAAGLAELSESAHKIFEIHLPKLRTQLEVDTDAAKDTIEDIREECSHINYHIQDLKLPPDVDPWIHILAPKAEH